MYQSWMLGLKKERPWVENVVGCLIITGEESLDAHSPIFPILSSIIWSSLSTLPHIFSDPIPASPSSCPLHFARERYEVSRLWQGGVMELVTHLVRLRAAQEVSWGINRRGGQKGLDSGNVGNDFAPQKMHHHCIELCRTWS